ncbi:MAG TPA: hypothetical protein VMI75_24210 [Polyangiaceae bacterium]|nr:hypothetical protein [Polyangiaceae bacterium]
MGAFQSAGMRPAIVEVLDNSHGDAVWCATFELDGDPSRFVQVLSNALNLAYPIVAPPAHVLAKDERLAQLAVMDWKANDFLTLELPVGASAKDVANLADALFQVIFGCGDDYRVDVKVTQLG